MNRDTQTQIETRFVHHVADKILAPDQILQDLFDSFPSVDQDDVRDLCQCTWDKMNDAG